MLSEVKNFGKAVQLERLVVRGTDNWKKRPENVLFVRKSLIVHMKMKRKLFVKNVVIGRR